MKYFIIVLMLIGSGNVVARDYEHGNRFESVAGSNTTLNNVNSNGTALSLGASSIDCTYSTQRFQMGVGLGVYNDNAALVVGGCKRFNSTLIKGTVGREGSKVGFSIGVMFPLN